MEALVGLARVALAGGELSQVMVHFNEILGHLRAHTLDGTYEPFRIYWTCPQVLIVCRMARARELVCESWTEFEEVSISGDVTVVWDRLEPLAAAEESDRQMGVKGLEGIESVGPRPAQVVDAPIRQWA
jgi:hypothetical protein